MTAPIRPAPLLERALIFCWLIHGIAMLLMLALLLPTMPGGPTLLDADRIALIAQHPWRFRLGWLPWQLTAASDLVLAVALVRTPFIPRLAAWISLLLTFAAVIPDQLAQALWITRGVELAQASQASGSATSYLAFEARIFPLTAVWGALLYTLGALGWTACFVGAGTWNRTLSILSIFTWGTFGVVTVGPLLPPPLTVGKQLLAAGNALGFLLLMLWLALVTEEVMRKPRPQPLHGRWARWRAPSPGLGKRALEILANSRLVRRLCCLLPLFEFRSDITNVIYVNYLVEWARLLPWVPEGLSLQRLGPDGKWALFTFLTYRHGHFGPGFLGPLRRLFSSPVQTNWRTYVRDDRTGKEGIYFVTNAVTTTLHSLGARLMAEGMPMHLLARGQINRSGGGAIHLLLDPGAGSAPDALANLAPSGERTLDGPWAECFADYRAMLSYTVPQDRALSTRPEEGETVRHEIDLGIPLESCEPLQGSVQSVAVAAIVGAAAPLCFRVPSVPFHFSGEQRDRWPPNQGPGKESQQGVLDDGTAVRSL